MECCKYQAHVTFMLTNAVRRFYPSFASISTHFVKLRATAMGIAIAGSGVGEPYHLPRLMPGFDACD